MAGHRKIEVDEQVYSYLLKNIKDFNETPNSVLRRLFRLGSSPGLLDTGTTEEDGDLISDKSKRKPQTKISELVNKGYLGDGEKLHLKINDVVVCTAKIQGDLLDWQSRQYSMSALAVKFLQEQGYETEHARGPAYWFTNEGISVKELWDEYLEKHYFLT